MTAANKPSLTETQQLYGTKTLSSVAFAMSQTLKPKELGETALQFAMEASAADAGLIFLLQKTRIAVLAATGFPSAKLEHFKNLQLVGKQTFVSHLLRQREPLILANLNEYPNDELAVLFRLDHKQSLMALSFDAPGKTPGVLIVAFDTPDAFAATDIDLLQSIVAQISSGLHYAWLYSKSQRQLDELRAVTEAAKAVVSSLDLQEILNHLMEEVTTRLKTEAAAILLLNQIHQVLEFVAVAGPDSEGLVGIQLPLDHGIVGWVAAHNEPVMVADVTKDPRFFDLDKQTSTVSQAILCVPLRARNELIGVVEVINKKRGDFNYGDQRLLEALASFAAVAIENARYYEEANRQIDQAMLFGRDISTTYRRERQERKALDKLRFGFLNVVSHELKTPLTVILQGLEALKNPRRGALNDEQTEIVGMLSEQSTYLNRLIEGLITFATFSAKQGMMKFRLHSVGEVVEEALTLSHFKAMRKNVTLTNDCQCEMPTLPLDKDHLAEGLAHLLENAIKYSPENAEVILRSYRDEKWLTIQVIDQGVGIPANQLETIWDSFTQMNTTMERGLEGLGLGLAITRYIVEAHDGRISVESELERGSTFTIKLPLSNQ